VRTYSTIPGDYCGILRDGVTASSAREQKNGRVEQADHEFLVAPHSERPIAVGEVLALYQAQGWWPERTVGQVSRVLAGGPAVGAWRDEVLIGFARAVTDGVLRAYVEDVVVAERFRGTGVGQAVVRRLLALLDPIPVVSLFCARGLVPFYEAADFRPTAQVVLHRR
jgi:GNAT superfamily N-acetyltransferase